MDPVATHWKRYAAAALVELIAAQTNHDQYALEHLTEAREELERAIESFAEEREVEE